MQKANDMWSAGSTDLFSNREISLLIELVKALPVLYAADKKSFKAIVPREKAWKIISEKLSRSVGECEKKWRYLRDKYVKERRRLLDECKSTGKEVKSNWQHYESMEFLSVHLRLPCNNGSNADKCSALPHVEDDDSLKYSGDSPTTSVVSPLNVVNDASDLNINQELNLQPQATDWASKPSYPSTQGNPELFQGANSSLIAPPSYQSAALFGRPPALTHNPLWAMWANGMQQASQQLNNLRASCSQQTHPVTATTSTDPDPNLNRNTNQMEQKEGEEEERKTRKRGRQSDNSDINIQLSLADVQPDHRYSEYHFCVSLAQMMENVPLSRRSELKVKLLQTISSAAEASSHLVNSSDHSLSL